MKPGLTWNEHVAIGQELHCIIIYLKHLTRKLEGAYGPNNPTASAVLPAFGNLLTLRQKLNSRILDEANIHRHDGHTDITYVYNHQPVDGGVLPLRERELP